MFVFSAGFSWGPFCPGIPPTRPRRLGCALPERDPSPWMSARTPALSATGQSVANSPDDDSVIDLRNRTLAAFLAWCVPGLGHFYPGRKHKGRPGSYPHLALPKNRDVKLLVMPVALTINTTQSRDTDESSIRRLTVMTLVPSNRV